jgi:hypothetical protein
MKGIGKLLIKKENDSDILIRIKNKVKWQEE